MIYTVTLNPSLDYIVSVDHFTPGLVNRTSREMILPGGKGLNVSMVLKNLGADSTALGFVAGFTGEEIRRRITEFDLQERLISLQDGISRINVKLRSDQETEINAMGPAIDEEALLCFYKQIEELKEGDVLVLAGSIPVSLPNTIYGDIMKKLAGKGVEIVVDATGKLLLNVLQYHPFLIKPNHHELAELLGVEAFSNRGEIAKGAKWLQEKGARNVLVSMAGDGAVLVTEDGQIYEADAPKGEVVNSVGAGDSMVAGFLYGYQCKGSYKDAFYYGLCTGSASAFSENLAMAKEVEVLLEQLI